MSRTLIARPVAALVERLEVRRLRAATLGPDGTLAIQLAAGDDLVLIEGSDPDTLTSPSTASFRRSSSLK